MTKQVTKINRRKFLNRAKLAAVGTAASTMPLVSLKSQTVSSIDNLNVIGPKKGYTPHIGTMLSMMNWMRDTILYTIKDLSVKDLDYLHDEESNTIGAMLWHLASTERYYQMNTFDDKSWGSWSREEKNKWDIGMNLGNKARAEIKGNKIDFYLEKLNTVRQKTKDEFAKRDDDWLLAVDNSWGWGPTNNYCKWFHVCEHESNHNGQIKYIKSRIK